MDFGLPSRLVGGDDVSGHQFPVNCISSIIFWNGGPGYRAAQLHCLPVIRFIFFTSKLFIMIPHLHLPPPKLDTLSIAIAKMYPMYPLRRKPGRKSNEKIGILV
jgi:hypothetical protein